MNTYTANGLPVLWADSEDTGTVSGLRWEPSFERRGWGVKSICIEVPQQELTVLRTHTDENGEETETEEHITLRDCMVDFTPNDCGTICPEHLEKDGDGSWVLVFE